MSIDDETILINNEIEVCRPYIAYRGKGKEPISLKDIKRKIGDAQKIIDDDEYEYVLCKMTADMKFPKMYAFRFVNAVFPDDFSLDEGITFSRETETVYVDAQYCITIDYAVDFLLKWFKRAFSTMRTNT